MNLETIKVLIINLIFSFIFVLVMLKIDVFSFKEITYAQAVFVLTAIFYMLANISYIAFYFTFNVIKLIVNKIKERKSKWNI